MSLKYSFKDNNLIINDHSVSFLAPVDTVLEVKNGLVVLLAPMTQQSEQNIFFINLDGTIKWQIEHLGLPEAAGYQGYTYIGFDKEGGLEANNFRGVLCSVNIDTGAIFNCIGERG